MTRYFPLLMSAAIFAGDQATKAWVRGAYALWSTHPVIPGFFNLVHAENKGAAFSLLNDAPPAVRTVVLIGLAGAVTLFLAYSLLRAPAAGESARTRYGFALILGGAVGNLYDRIASGAVTDFLEFFIGTYAWPAFNVADSAITVGAGLLLLDLWFGRRAQQAPVTQ
jgi:signal peptidase II